MDLVKVKNNQIVTSSRNIARSFSKDHKTVLRSIREILSAQNCANAFFHQATYVYNNRTLPEYYMNRDGFSLLVMGFTGKIALEWKIKYIDAFNKMEKALTEKQAPVLTANNPMASITWRGRIMMMSTTLASISGIHKTTLMHKAKRMNIPMILLTGTNLQEFKKENGMPKRLSSRILLYPQDSVTALLKEFGTYDKHKSFMFFYFKETKSSLVLRQAVEISAAIASTDRKITALSELIRQLPFMANSPERQITRLKIAQDFALQITSDLLNAREELSSAES